MGQPARSRAVYEEFLKDNARVRAEPFHAIDLDLGVLWAR